MSSRDLNKLATSIENAIILLELTKHSLELCNTEIQSSLNFDLECFIQSYIINFICQFGFTFSVGFSCGVLPSSINPIRLNLKICLIKLFAVFIVLFEQPSQ